MTSTNQPYHRLRGRPNIWGEPADKTFTNPGHHKAGRFLASRLLEEGIDMSYAYKPLHEDGLGHAFANTLLFLDLDRKGFNYPVLPVAVNCYGSAVIRNRGGGAQYSDEPDPPSPSPRRCFEMGQATARVLKDSPWRVVLMASSSWSHAFLTEKNHLLYPDLESDRAMLEQLRAGEYTEWRDVPLAQMEAAGQVGHINALFQQPAGEKAPRLVVSGIGERLVGRFTPDIGPAAQAVVRLRAPGRPLGH